MGVEERIGTCTADAVLLEGSATHYEREYGPGAHAAGLAVYTGSLYQSNRSTFRPLMRVSSGVRNLIAGAAVEAGAVTVTQGALRAHRRRRYRQRPVRRRSPSPGHSPRGAEQPRPRRRLSIPPMRSPTLGAYRSMSSWIPSSTGGREMGEAGAVMRAEDLPELTRCADTAERLGALQVSLRMDATESASETTGGFRASELEGAVSMHPAIGGGGALEIEPPSAVHGENAPIARPHPGVAGGEGPEMQLGLLGGADRPLGQRRRRPTFLRSIAD